MHRNFGTSCMSEGLFSQERPILLSFWASHSCISCLTLSLRKCWSHDLVHPCSTQPPYYIVSDIISRYCCVHSEFVYLLFYFCSLSLFYVIIVLQFFPFACSVKWEKGKWYEVFRPNFVDWLTLSFEKEFLNQRFWKWIGNWVWE